MIPTNMTAINEQNTAFADKEEKENNELENLVGDMGSDNSGSNNAGGEEDIFDKQLKESALDDHKSLKDSMMDTYRETMSSLNEDDINNTKKQEVNKTLSFA